MVPPRLSVKELKLAITAETGGVLPLEAQEFRRSQAETYALLDTEILDFSENDILILRTHKVDPKLLREEQRKATIAKNAAKKKKCAIM